MKPSSILLVSMDEELCDRVAGILEKNVNFQISLAVDNFTEACLHEADILLLDLVHQDAADELRWNALTLAHPNIPVIAIFQTYNLALRLALAKGVHGFVPREAGDAALLQALREVPQGLCVVPSDFVDQLKASKTGPLPETDTPQAGLIEPLTKREREILVLLAQGLSNKQIGQRLLVTEQSVKNRLRDIYGKLGVSRRVQALLAAKKLGLLEDIEALE